MARWLQKYRWYLLFTTAVGMMVYYGLRGEKVGLPNLFGALPQGPQPQAGEVIGVSPTVKPPADSSVPVQPPSDVEAQVEVPGAEDFSDSPVYVPDPIEGLRDQAYEAMGGDGEFYTEEPFSWEKLEDPLWMPEDGLIIPLKTVKEVEAPQRVEVSFVWHEESKGEVDRMFLMYPKEVKVLSQLLLDEGGNLVPDDERADIYLNIQRYLDENRLVSPYWFLERFAGLRILLTLLKKVGYEEAIFVVGAEDPPDVPSWIPEYMGLLPEDYRTLIRGEEIRAPIIGGRIVQEGDTIRVTVLNWQGRRVPIFRLYEVLFVPQTIGPVRLALLNICLISEETGEQICARLFPGRGQLSGMGKREIVNYKVEIP